MKEIGTTHWLSPNQVATNSSGFTGLPGGYRYGYGTFGHLGYSGTWWSSSEYPTTGAWGRFLGYDSGIANRYGNVKTYGLYVRCLRD